MNKKISDLSPAELKSYAERGIIQIVITNKLPTRIEDTPEYKKNAHLAGTQIHISEAARKYDIPQQTISRYVTKGIIKSIGRDGNKIMLDESYVAYAKEVIKRKKAGQGKWIFDKDGLPYIQNN